MKNKSNHESFQTTEIIISSEYLFIKNKRMQQQQGSAIHQVDQQQQQQLTMDQLRQSIHLSSSKLLELAYSQQKYIDTIVDFNKQAIQHMDRQQQQEALVYLGQAERALQYGASCGKAIDRNLIICILNNQACCHYRQGQLAKCASYLQGVIYNLKAFGTSMQSSPNGSSYLQTHSNNNKSKKSIDEFYHVSLQKKIQLVHYNLRYCTINSQLSKREVALKAGQTIVKLVKGLFTDVTFQNPKLYPSPQLQRQLQQQQLSDIKQLIRNQTFLKQNIQPQQLQVYRKLARIYVKKWNQRKLTNKLTRQLQKSIRDYSISEVIEILPLQYMSSSDALYQSVCNSKVVMRQFLHLAMGYFTISTEYRLLAQHRYPILQEKLLSQQWKSANIYHLFGIIYLANNLNSDLLFMKQLISSYQQHYKTQILLEEHLSDQELESLSQRLLFEPKKEKLSKQNQLLFQKIAKLKEKQESKSKNKSFKKPNDKSLNKSGQYKTLNSSKLNASKDMPATRKRSVSKQQATDLSSSKKITQKNSLNSSSINKVKTPLQTPSQQTKKPTRKRSYSKDSVKQSNPPQTELKKSTQIQRTANQYQLQTPDKKATPVIRKRRISSVSSGKDIVVPNRQFSKNNKLLTTTIGKQKQLKTEKEKFKSPNTKFTLDKNTKAKTQKVKQKNTLKQHKPQTKTKKKVQKQQKQKQHKKKSNQPQNAYYF